MLRAVDALRAEHQIALEREAKRTDQWIKEIKESHTTEKTHLLERIAALEREEVGKHGSDTDSTGEWAELGGRSMIIPETHALAPTTSAVETPTLSESLPELRHDVTTPVETTLPSSLSATATPFVPSTTVVTTSPVSSVLAMTPSHETPIVSAEVVPDVGTSLDTRVTPLTGLPHVTALTTAAVSIPSSSVTPVAVSAVGSTLAAPPTSSIAVTAPLTGHMAMDVVSTMAWLLKVQTDAMAKAAAVQNLPPLPCFTGEGDDLVEDGYDKWVEKFRERARFANWSLDDQLSQLKLHLDKTARDVLHMLPSTKCSDVESAIRALGTRFKPRDIEELRGLEFHHKTQGDESIDQLGISIQQLGRKAFPSIVGKDFDHLLKGHFYQALLVKWQRKLGAPKPDESFHDLLARAHMLEEHEKQFQASAESRSDKVGRKTKSGATDPKQNGTHKEIRAGQLADPFIAEDS